ncbi:MAG: undecaprenyl-diphosphate phosphatase [Verrucomicrobia bacterium]|nr:undecaprenyl-diphosphate phosphatase [Verrucomicrobiota bacterium]
MPDWVVTILLGCLEGITEFLPVSSTGHLLLAEHWMGIHRSDLFNIVIQAGAVLAVIPLFWGRVSRMLFDWRDPEVRDYAAKLALAFVITGVGGLLLEKAGFELPETPLPVGVALLVGGLLFILVERWVGGRPVTDQIGWTIAVAVGIGQLIAAVFPGTSRSGATILMCLLLGLSRTSATEFSFLVGIPTMLAASGLKIVKAVIRPAGSPGLAEDWIAVALGFLTAAIVSFIVVRWLLGYVKHHTFAVFGWYRILLAVLVLTLLR